jgi:hypothetical protein
VVAVQLKDYCWENGVKLKAGKIEPQDRLKPLFRKGSRLKIYAGKTPFKIL